MITKSIWISVILSLTPMRAQRQPPLVPPISPQLPTSTPAPSPPGTPTQQNLTIIGPLVPNCQGACMLSRILCPAARIRCVVPSTCYQIVPVPVAVANGTNPQGTGSPMKPSDLIYGGKIVPPYNAGVNTRCEDKSKNCAAFSDLCKESIYQVFMRHHCRRTCGFCTDSPHVGSTTDPAKPPPISSPLPTPPPPPPSPTSSSLPSPMRRLKPTTRTTRRRMRKLKTIVSSTTTEQPTTSSAQPDASTKPAPKSSSAKGLPQNGNNTVTNLAVQGGKAGKPKNVTGSSGAANTTTISPTTPPSAPSTTTAAIATSSRSTTEASSSSIDGDAAQPEGDSSATKAGGRSAKESAATSESAENTTTQSYAESADGEDGSRVIPEN